MDWARYIVALGALMGIITTTLVGVKAWCSDASVVCCACVHILHHASLHPVG